LANLLGVVLPQRVRLSPIANDYIISIIIIIIFNSVIIKGYIINVSESAGGCFIPNTAAQVWRRVIVKPFR